METKIYFTVKVLCAIFIFYQLWIFIFSPKIYDGWDKVYRSAGKRKLKVPAKRQGARNRQWQQKWYKKFPEQ